MPIASRLTPARALFLIRLAIAFLLFVCAFDLSHAGESRRDSCVANALGEWNNSEREVWSEICSGSVTGRSIVGASEKRSIRASFLISIIQSSMLSGLLPLQGLTTANLSIYGDFDISRSNINIHLDFSYCDFLGRVDFDWISSSSDISFRYSRFSEDVSMRFMKLDRSLLLGSLEFSESRDPFSDRSPRSLFKQLDLTKSRFGDDVVIVSADIKRIIGVFLRVGGSLILNHVNTGEVNFAQSRITDQLVIVDDTISAHTDDYGLTLYSVQVGEVLHLNRTKITGMVDCEYMDVHGAMILRNASLSNISIAGSNIAGTVDFGTTNLQNEQQTAVNWIFPSRLKLHGAKVTSILASKDSHQWPNQIGLEDFSYQYIGEQPFGSPNAELLPASWYIDLLDKDDTYSPQPYETLAKVLRDSGRNIEANDVLFAGKVRELRKLTSDHKYLAAFWMLLFEVFIGFGYRTWYSLIWAVGLVSLGAIVFARSDEAKLQSMPFGIAFSFDKLLPLIKLRERHSKIDFSGWERYYFYFHQFMGFVLGSFILAALSGLTK